MARKKIVFIIVEGPSDDEALGVLFNRIFDRNSVFVHIMHRDITTDRGVRQDNILSRLGNEVRTYAKSNHFTNKDFQEIIHITDMDGAYVLQNILSIRRKGSQRVLLKPSSLETGKNGRIWTNCAPVTTCGIFLIGYSICPAISIMCYMISSILPIPKKRPMPTLLLCGIAMILRRSGALSQIQIFRSLPAIKTRGTLSKLEWSL